MKEVVKKLNTVKDEILSEKGSLLMFLLIERNDTDGKWDILFSADWVQRANNEEDLIYVIDKLKKEFNSNLEFLSRIVIGTPTDNFILRIARAINRQDASVGSEITDLAVTTDFTVHHLHVIALNFSNDALEKEGIDETGPIAVRKVSEF